jgi:hypothetical protein
MKPTRKSIDYVNLALHILGFSLCIMPPAVCTLLYFPIWNEVSGARTLAGGCALLLVLSLYPLIKYARRILASVSSYVMWLVIFLLFLSLSAIAKEMTVISFFGFVGNLLGAVCFRVIKMRRSGNVGEQ